MIQTILKETQDYRAVIANDREGEKIYNIINKNTGVIESKGYMLPVILSDLNSLQVLLSNQSGRVLTDAEYDSLLHVSR